ncbi:hypothetical protein [Pseudarthrobacter sp. NPDC057230]
MAAALAAMFALPGWLDYTSVAPPAPDIAGATGWALSIKRLCEVFRA